MTVRPALLIKVLREPGCACRLTLSEWGTLIRQGRSAQLLPRLATILREHELLQRIPSQPRGHLQASLNQLARQQQAVRWEVEHLLFAFEQAEVPLTLLKGAAYIMADLPPGRCRMFSDFDVLVPKASLARVETVMMMHGWVSNHQSAYDQRYYRTWMHELPPMRHISRQSVIDIHHNIVPDTARYCPDPGYLLDSSVPCPNRPAIRVLLGYDMILHSAVHLFHDGEFDHALRDLFDLNDLVSHFIQLDKDWLMLIQRSVQLNLVLPLYYTLRYLQRILGFSIPSMAIAELNKHQPVRGGMVLRDAIFERALQPDNPTCSDWLTGMSRFALYIRGHALRMPLRLLLPHLARKALIRANLLPEAGR